MRDRMSCEQVLREELARRYLLGALSAADQEAFEQHYFECASCFDELENMRLLRQALAPGAAAGGAGSAARGGRASWRWAAAAAVVALVAGGLYLGWDSSNGPRRGSDDGEGRLAGQRPAASMQSTEAPSQPVPESASRAQPERSAPRVAAGGAGRSEALASLAVVQPPDYTPAVLRGALDEAGRRFREAMRLYVSRDYGAAKAELRAAAALDRERPDIAFFLGVCALLTGETAAAVAELERTIALGESPYREDAHFYLAKAHLRRGELADAAAELAATVRLRGEREQEARELLEKLEALRRSSASNVPPA